MATPFKNRQAAGKDLPKFIPGDARKYDSSLKVSSVILRQELGRPFTVVCRDHPKAANADLHERGYYPEGKFQVVVEGPRMMRWWVTRAVLTQGLFQVSQVQPQRRAPRRFKSMREVADYINDQI